MAKSKFWNWITTSSWSPFSWLFNEEGEFDPLDPFNANARVADHLGASGVSDVLDTAGDIVSGGSDNDTGLDLRSALVSWLKSMSGAGLTDAQIEQNKWNEQMAVNAYDRSREARQTQFQDLVGSAQAAGINPVLAVNGGLGSSAVSAPASSGSTPDARGLQDLIGLAQLKFQKDQLSLQGKEVESKVDLNSALSTKARAEAAAAAAGAKESGSRSAYYDALTQTENETRELKKRGYDDAHDMSVAEQRRVWKAIDQAEQEIQTMKDQSGYYIANSILSRASAQQITTLTPVLKNYYEQSAVTLGAQANAHDAAARLSTAKALFEEGLLDNDIVTKTIQELDAKISLEDAKALAQEFTNAIRSGDKDGKFFSDDLFGRFLNHLAVSLNLLKETTLGGIIGG